MKMLHTQTVTKKLNGKYAWESAITFENKMFNECIVKSPIDTIFHTKKSAETDMIRVLKKLKIINT